jgi:hypothetical protein
VEFEDIVSQPSEMGDAMSDRFAFFVIFALIGGACYVVASIPHITAYSTVITWATRLMT